MASYQVSNATICGWLWAEENKKKNQIKVIMDEIRRNNCFNEAELKIISDRLTKVFLPHYRARMKQHRYIISNFKTYAKTFLKNDFTVKFADSLRFPNSQLVRRKPIVRKSARKGRVSVGRPKLSFVVASQRTKYRIIKSGQKNGEIETSVKNTSSKSCFKKNKKVNSDKNVINLKECRGKCDNFLNKSLATFMDSDMTSAKWEKLRQNNNKMFGNKIYPNYKEIQKAKTKCYPKNISITEDGARVNLQSLLEHTTTRIFEVLKAENLAKYNGKDLILNLKYGMDGSSSQRVFQHKKPQQEQQEDEVNEEEFYEVNEIYEENEEEEDEEEEVAESQDENDERDEEAPIQKEINYASVFSVSCVPLNLQCGDKFVWKNDRPSSIRLCRPIEFKFMKESFENVAEIHKFYEAEIQNLTSTTVNIGDNSFRVSYNLSFTMIDGKTCNVLTNQKASGSCNICGSKPSQMNKIDEVSAMSVKDEYFRFGLSTLHCKIRFMECLLNIAYHIDFKKNSCRGFKEQKTLRKRRIQSELKKHIGIVVDVVKQGFGTTNTGNTARRFFNNPKKVSKILGVNEEIVARFSVILQVLSCNRQIDVNAFETYARETANLFVKLYPWKFMPPTVHKVLIHGSRIIECFEGCIGQYAEEAQEANNKVFRDARASKSRLRGNKENHIDVMHYLLIASDPVISSLRVQTNEKQEKLSNNAKKLLK